MTHSAGSHTAETESAGLAGGGKRIRTSSPTVLFAVAGRAERRFRSARRENPSLLEGGDRRFEFGLQGRVQRNPLPWSIRRSDELGDFWVCGFLLSAGGAAKGRWSKALVRHGRCERGARGALAAPRAAAEVPFGAAHVLGRTRLPPPRGPFPLAGESVCWATTRRFSPPPGPMPMGK